MKLLDILNEMLHGRTSYQELTGGLRLQFREADDTNGQNRLLCYRLSVKPATKELVAVRQHLEKLLPSETRLQLGEEFTYDGQDGRVRHCRVFSWRQASHVQASLFEA